MRANGSIVAILGLCAASACVQAPAPRPPQAPATASPASGSPATGSPATGSPATGSPAQQGEGQGQSQGEDAAGKSWKFAASAYTYFVPDGRDYVQPTITADRDRLHLEARYNYEAQDTGSLWAGYAFAGGTELPWEITPMLGGVLGEVDGVAPGYKGSLGWRRFELYSEGEYLISTSSASDSFFYNWSELTFAPVERLRVGIVTQRTRAYQADRVLERGLLLGFATGRLQFSAYVFNPDESKPITVVSVALGF